MTTHEVQLSLDERGKGAFFIEEDGERVAVMEIKLRGTELTVYHTEVERRLARLGLSTKLLAAMVDYARSHDLKVIAICPFVYIQFARHEAQYADIWKKTVRIK